MDDSVVLWMTVRERERERECVCVCVGVGAIISLRFCDTHTVSMRVLCACLSCFANSNVLCRHIIYFQDTHGIFTTYVYYMFTAYAIHKIRKEIDLGLLFKLFFVML